MSMAFLVNADGTGLSWAGDGSWEFGDYPAPVRDKYGNFYLFYVEVIDFGEETEVTNLYMLKKPVETGVWETEGTLKIADICYGDIGVTYNSSIGEHGRLILALWKEKVTPTIYYSDNLGASFTEMGS
jgi:hypothetical protein